MIFDQKKSFFEEFWYENGHFGTKIVSFITKMVSFCTKMVSFGTKMVNFGMKMVIFERI